MGGAPGAISELAWWIRLQLTFWNLRSHFEGSDSVMLFSNRVRRVV